MSSQLSTTASLSLIHKQEMQRAARSLSHEHRQQILMSIPEVKLHPYLKELFQAIDSDYLIEVTHGTKELGKDLILVKRNALTTDVIGVVVKCGDISGKTLGETDELKQQVESVEKLKSGSEKTVREIESQIQQAHSHPAELHSIFKSLPVNKIMVILAGRLSGNARVRIERELNLGDNVRDIGWLVDHFTEHYPQVFFAGKSIDFLQDKIQHLETGDWLADSDKNLSEWWVEPVVATVDVPTSFDLESIESLLRSKRFPFAALAKIVKKNRHVILAGDPGSGKSAAMAKLALNMLRIAHEHATRYNAKNSESPEPLDIPILVTARELWEAENIHELQAAYFGSPEIAGNFHVQVLLIDALDELPVANRLDAVEKARIFANELGCSLIITSRKIDVIRNTPTGFRQYELMPFELGQALQLCEKLLTGNPMLAALREGLKKVEDQIPLTPLSLVLLMEVAKEHGEVPSSLTELYDRFFDMVLGRYEAKKGILVLFEPLVKRRFLASLAYHEFFRKDRLEIPESDFEEFCQSYAQEYGYDKDKLQDFISEVDRAGILFMRETLEFKHRSFLDYFVSSWIYDNSDEIENLNDFLAETYFGDLWSDVTFFYVGLKRRITSALLKCIFEHPDNTLSGHASKLLSGKLLQAGWNSAAQIKTLGVQGAFQSAPHIKSQLATITDKTGRPVPKIIADFFVMSMAEASLRSGHLSDQLKILLDDLLSRESDHDIRMLPVVLWTVSPFLTQEELATYVEFSLEIIAKPGLLTAEEKASFLVLMSNLETPNRELTKSIELHMRRYQRRHPEAFRALFPPTRKGFRPQKTVKKLKS